MQAGSRKNMDRISEAVPDCKSRNLQQFLTHSKWNAREVIKQVARETDSLLGDTIDTGLIIDESGFAKQGQMSVGVSRQWLGRLGKVDNGQVAVYGVLANDRFAAPVDARLYLPKNWIDDPKRCTKAGVPASEQIFKTKDELALEIVQNARSNGLRFGWVGADAGYGKGQDFPNKLDAMNETFIIDLHSDFHVYIENPKPYIPCKKSKRGPNFKRYQTDAKSIEVQKIFSESNLDEQPVLKLRKTSRGFLKVKALRIPVYTWDGETAEGKERQLIITKTIGPSSDLKISITNTPLSIGIKKLAWMQRQRFWVERVFEDAKSECGMADYQVRKWDAWHHHMALVMMAVLFMLEERIRHKESYPLLSCADIEDLLSKFLPRRNVTKEEIISQLEYRHRKRLSAIASHSRCAT